MNTPTPNNRTMKCPSGCHEEYLERTQIHDDLARDGEYRYFATEYLCIRCNWKAIWDNRGMLTVLEASDHVSNPIEEPELEYMEIQMMMDDQRPPWGFR